jgi:AcrR family transcriptional regulator
LYNSQAMVAGDRQGPGKKQLTPEMVVGRALVLADAVGLGGVTIRRLAGDLGVTPMALYWHFRNKDELLDAMMARIFSEVDPVLGESARWQEQFRTLMDSLAGALRAHPGAAPLFATRTNSSESSLRVTEVALDILRRGGFSPTEATRVSRHALSTIVNLVAGEPGFIAPEDSGELLDARRRARLYRSVIRGSSRRRPL